MEKTDYSKLYRGEKPDFDEVHYMTAVAQLINQIRGLFEKYLMSAHSAQKKNGIEPGYHYSMEHKLPWNKLDRNHRIYMNGAIAIEDDYKSGDYFVLTPYGRFATGIDKKQLLVGSDIEISFAFENEISRMIRNKYEGKDFSRSDDNAEIIRDKTMPSDKYSILFDENKKPTILSLPKMLKAEKAHLQDVIDLVSMNYVRHIGEILPGEGNTYRIDGKDFSIDEVNSYFPDQAQVIKAGLEAKMGIKKPLVKEDASAQNTVSIDTGREM